MMKTYFVTADIHGFFDEWKAALDKVGFDKKDTNHILVVLGDIVDRGRQPVKVINFLLSLPEERTILITGNHEDLLDDLVERGTPLPHDKSNGTYATLRSLENDMLFRYYDLRRRMINYYEMDNKVFVHGWIPCITEITRSHNREDRKYAYRADWRNASDSEWQQARWYNGMELWSRGVIEEGKTIYCGHWHSSYGNVRKAFPGKTDEEYRELEFADKNYFSPFIDDGIVALDGCTAFTGIVNVEVIVI